MASNDPTPSTAPSADTSSYEQDRRAKLQKLRELGIDPFGHRVEGIQPLKAIKSSYTSEMGHDGGPAVKVAGRIMFKRDMGKLTFLTLRDDSGEDLQCALDKKRLSERDWQINELLDLGDQIVVSGKLGTTKKGETTVWASLDPVADGALMVASKALLNPPGKFHGLEDIEQRYRQRYVDLWANPEVMQLALLRTRMVQEMRNYLSGLGYIEVETPMMQIIHGGAAARPFVTHHNALDIPLYMRIAPELFLKRLLVGGMRKVFEINRNFRNEGISPRHNPEFTMLEAYDAYGSWETMADMVEGMVCHLAETLFGGLRIVHRGDAEGAEKRVVNLSRPWRRVRMDALVEERTGWKFDQQSIGLHADALTDVLAKYDAAGATALARNASGLQLHETEQRAADRLTAFRTHLLTLSPAEQLQEVYEKLVEPTLVDPCFVTHVPSVIIPLAKPNRDDPFFADVYELAINGVEISPGYTELNDPDVQAKQFAHQVGDAEEQQKVDEDFLTALKYGMPPAGGMGLGVDRLLMMLTGAESIRDVILFPLMRPQ